MGKKNGNGIAARIKKPLILFVITAVFLVLWVVLFIAFTFPDIEITRVSFANDYSGSGETIEGLLLTPDPPSDEPMPAVVFCHGLSTYKEIYLPLYRDLARRGIAVLAVDLPGHGGSGGHSDLGNTEYTAVLAAYDWLTSNHPEIDPGRVAAAGHSLGGVTSTRAGILQPDKKFSAVVAIWCWQSERSTIETISGPLEDYTAKLWPLLLWSKDYDPDDESAHEERDIISKVGPGIPPNYLVIVGDWDEGITVEQERELVARAAGLEDVEPGVVYGSFEDGTARSLVVTSDDHVTEIFSSQVFEAMYEWLCDSFGMRSQGTMPIPFIHFTLWTWILGAAILLSFLLLIMLFRVLERRMASPVVLALPGAALAPGKLRLMGTASTLFYLLISAFTFPLAILLGITVLVPFLVGDIVSSIAVVRGLLTLLGAAAGLFFFYGVSREQAAIPRGEKARAIIWSAVPVLGAFALFLVVYTPLARLLYLGQGLPYSWGWFLLFVALVTPMFWIEGRYFHLFLLPLFGEVGGWKKKLSYLASEAGVRSVAQVMLLLPFLIADPLRIIGREGSIRMPVLVGALLVAFPLYFILAWADLRCRERKISLLLPSLAITLFQALMLTAFFSVR